MNKVLTIAALVVASFGAKAQKIQFYTLEAGCKMEIWKDRSGEKPLPIQRTERLGQFREIEVGVWNIEIKCTAKVSMMLQITNKDGKTIPMADNKAAKDWHMNIVPLDGEKYVFTPFAPSTYTQTNR